MSSTSGDPLDAVHRILERGGDADDILRDVVTGLHEDAGYAWAGILFLEDGELVLGPHAGTEDDAHRTSTPVTWQGDAVAQLAVDGAPEADRADLEQIAQLIAGHCLVGWDTGGESWEP